MPIPHSRARLERQIQIIKEKNPDIEIEDPSTPSSSSLTVLTPIRGLFSPVSGLSSAEISASQSPSHTALNQGLKSGDSGAASFWPQQSATTGPWVYTVVLLDLHFPISFETQFCGSYFQCSEWIEPNLVLLWRMEDFGIGLVSVRPSGEMACRNFSYISIGYGPGMLAI